MKRLLVTGAGGSAGRALIEGLGDDFEVLGTRRDIGPFRLDVTDPESWSRLLETQEVDAVLHTVGAFSYQPIDACDPGTWRSMMSSNLDSAFYAYHFCREALRRHRGRLIFFGLAGVSTHRAEPNLSAYAAAKSGLMSLVSSIARVEAPFGVTCNVIAPGLLHDASAEAVSRFRIPARRTATEGELVGCVRYLLSDEAAQVTGTTITLSGGWRL
ncbi:MAG: SDR family oxidoreductase [Myxococcota bacterium]|nr:SDR family oxidoreductase [Myxococcota bacterium]